MVYKLRDPKITDAASRVTGLGGPKDRRVTKYPQCLHSVCIFTALFLPMFKLLNEVKK